MKGLHGLAFTCVVLLLCTALIIPAFAEMKKVDEAELARTNASVSGVSVKDRVAGAKKGTFNAEKLQDMGISDKGDTVYSTSEKLSEGIGLNLNVSGQETFKYNFGAYNTNMTGGITSVQYYEGKRP